MALQGQNYVKHGALLMEPRQVIAETIIAASRYTGPPLAINETSANALADMIIAQLAGSGFQVVKADHPA